MPPWWSRSAVLLAMHPGTQLWRSLKELSGLLSCVFCGGEPSVKNQGSRCRESGQFKVDQNMALYASLSARNTCLADFCLPGSFNFIFFQIRKYIATLPARDFFPANFYPSDPFTCIFFSKTSLELFLCWLWLTPVPVRARGIKSVTLPIVTGS